MPAAARIAVDRSEDDLIRAHLPLVHHLVNEVAARLPRHVQRDELVAAGMVGLAQASRSYDPTRSVDFARFAGRRIRGAILDELRSRDWATRGVRAKAREQAAAGERLAARLGRTPTGAEVAAELGIDVREVDSVNRDVQRSLVLNLDAPGTEAALDRAGVHGSETPDALVLEHERRAYLVAAVANLPERLRRVVLGYFFEELPMHVLAEELGVTDSRISQMRAEALVLLRAALDSTLDGPTAAAAPAAAARRGTTRRQAYVSAVAGDYDPRRRLDRDAASLASLLSTRAIA